MNPKELFRKMMSNSFVIASLLGLIMNVTGVYDMLASTPLIELYGGAVNAAIAPISGVILFTIGYDLNADAKMLGPIASTAALRILTAALTIAGFYVLFPALMQDHIFRTAVLLYFMCPTGFATPTQLKPLCKDQSDEAFMSSFISLYMIVTLTVYVILVLTG